MRSVTYITAIFTCFTLLACAPPGPDSVRQAKQANHQSQIGTSKAAAKFLVEMVDARLMDYAEGKLAADRGTRSDVREYGREMMEDQPILLRDLRQLAADRAVTVPEVVGATKRQHYSDLYQKTGNDLDKAVIKSLRIDHERDVNEFRKAADFEDAGIRAYARKTLPIIERHLDDVEAIEERL